VPRKVSIHVSPDKRAAVLAGQAPVLAALEAVLTAAGQRVDWRLPDDPPERHHVMYNRAPLGPRGLVLRRAYIDPFYRLERSNDRWAWEVAEKPFDPALVAAGRGETFRARISARLWRQAAPEDGDFLLVALQGHLTRARSFQSMSPLAMIEALLQHDPRPVVATLHPRETYPEADRKALADLAARHPRLTLREGGTMDLLRRCAAVVTQNSAVALQGYFAGKRAALFARIDFHHIAGSVPRDGLEAALASLQGPPPPFTAYLYWFFKMNALNGQVPQLPDQIAARLADHGWLT
jgi:hypothetical protein